MWYFPLLESFDWKGGDSGTLSVDCIVGDHITVSPDLSDLGEAILWAKTHDAVCEKLAQNAQALYSRLIAMDGVLDYLQLMCSEISSRFTPHDKICEEAVGVMTAGLLAPYLSKPPGQTNDWFDAFDPDYAETSLGGQPSTLPYFPSLSTVDCTCPVCLSKIKAKRSQYIAPSISNPIECARNGAGDSLHGSGRAAKTATTSIGGNSKGVGGKDPTTSFIALGTTFPNLDRAKAAAAKAALAASVISGVSVDGTGESALKKNRIL